MFRNFYNVPAAVVLEPFENEIKEAAVALWKISLYNGEKISEFIAKIFFEKFVAEYMRRNFDVERLNDAERFDAWQMGEQSYQDKGRDYVKAKAYLAIIDYREITEGESQKC